MQNALVLGLGISGKAASRFLLKKGYRVFGFDDKKVACDDPSLVVLDLASALALLDERPLFVPSPGISPTHAIYVKALNLGLDIVGEIELGLEILHQPCIGVTGTNGKTTVVKCLEHVLNFSGRPAKAVGNVGESLLDALEQLTENEIAVLELSSYQLETAKTAKLDAAVILNITDDHLDRYATMHDYAEAKFRIQKLLKPQNKLFIDEASIKRFPEFIDGPINSLGYDARSQYWTDKHTFFAVNDQSYVWPKVDALRGLHDYFNSMVVWLLAKPFGLSWTTFCEALRTFKKPAHRIEFVAKIDEVTYINDSKATNPDATLKAVEALADHPIILIAGGADKQLSFISWKNLQGKVKKILAFGATQTQIYMQLHDTFEIECYNQLSEVVARAHEIAAAGDAVLLAPGCSSFDMFRSYVHRGEEFKKEVSQLSERRKSYVS